MSDKVAQLSTVLQKDGPSDWISNLWNTYNEQRSEWRNQKQETKQYLFATDSSTTSSGHLGWEHTTTLPKLCQIRDNLYSNYMSSLFPNDKWLKWEGYNKDSANKEKATSITSYMENKTREGGFKDEIGKLVYDYIDTGNAFAMPSFESRHNDFHGELIPSFIGPKAVRISPDDIVMNPLASSLERTFKIVRSVKTVGELLKLAETNPDQVFWKEVINKKFSVRDMLSGINQDDMNKAASYSVDGFGNLQEYYQSEYVEILEFYGDYMDEEAQEVSTNRMITIVDRSTKVRDVKIPTYSGEAPIFHVGWRKRPDNLWAMGPLDNLVGMQYMIDHLQNAKADATDMAIAGPLGIVGEVEPFVWGPKEQIHFPDGEGQVFEVAKNLQPVMAVENQIQILEDKMELYAGAPREAAGIRTPGEKTAFEVDSLQTAAGRIFTEKIVTFELFMEKLLNSMFEIAHRNFNEIDTIRTIDNDLGVASFKEITKDDITAKGILRPIGARHFSQKAKELQNLIGIFNTPALAQMLMPHTSGISMTEYIEDSLDIRGYDLFRPNVAIAEQQQTQGLVNQASEDLEVEQSTPVDDEI